VNKKLAEIRAKSAVINIFCEYFAVSLYIITLTLRLLKLY